ncbi:DUF1648 domain-containing protein [Kaistella antarctica]|uniref:Predicted integral membrane protein n=1 Tax=Kaistella antarctica TaxID=266748 RepID=A0A3S4V2Z0_9FLAO|nr:DUF1648 domain-containing protein [Kaistella antarctica]KEY17741.1 hypothetical protein HY04_04130 [Kaistella antarctica]SEV79573.1 Protein of unknown function [Kaistella antarctica]VEH99860.1 Predicted integral membrane protein [Kaistella antarctica]
MKKLPFYLKIISFVLLIFIWDYIFINYRNLPLSVPIHFDWDGKPNFFVPRIMIWFLAGIATFIYLLIFYLTRNINSPLLGIPQKIKDNTVKAERIVSVFHLIVMVVLTVITYESIAVGIGKYDAVSPVTNYLIVLLFIGVIAMMIYSFKISRKNGFQNPLT